MRAKIKKRNTNKKSQVTKPQSTKNKPVGGKSGKQVNDIKKQVKTRNQSVRRDKNGRILPGSGSNGGGRPIGSLSGVRIEEIRSAISRVELERRKPEKKRKIAGWLDHQVDKSYDDTSLAIAFLSRMYPALKAIEQLTMLADIYSPEDMKDMREKYSERFE